MFTAAPLPAAARHGCSGTPGLCGRHRYARPGRRPWPPGLAPGPEQAGSDAREEIAAVVAIPLGLSAVFLGRRALKRGGRTDRPASAA
ncbi:hypothetical protein GCM10023079_14150 [Streptomyces chitinivorans]